MTSAMGYDPYHHPVSCSTSSSTSSYRRWYTEVTTPAPKLTATKRGRAPLSVYSSHASPLSSSARLRYSSPSGRVFQPSTSSVTSSVEHELSQAARVGSEFRTVRTRERAQMQELNDRFAGFVERVHDLELQNRTLEADLERLRRRNAQPARLEALYEQEVRALRAAVDQVQAERQEALGRREHLEQTLGALEARHQEEALAREETESRLLEVRGAADQATLAQAEAEKRVEALLDELAFLAKVHEGEVAELQARVQLGVLVAAEREASDTTALDLSQALREIRAQYEVLAAKNVQSAEDWFRGKVGWLNKSVSQHDHAVRSSRGEAGEIRSQLQARLLEIDACRGINQSLEKQLHDAEENQAAEIAAMQELIQDQERELGATKQEMTRYLREYQDLLNVKMALDIEIAAYRKLLEGEESRFNVGGASIMYSSHALSVAPPSVSRPIFSGVSSGTPYLATTRVHLGSTFITREVVSTTRSQKAEALPQEEEEEEEKMEENEEEEEVEEKVEEKDDEEEGEEKEESEEGEEKEVGVEEEQVKEEEGAEDGGEENGEDEEEEKEDGRGDEEKFSEETGGGDEDGEKQETEEDTPGGGEGAEKETKEMDGGGEESEKTQEMGASEQVVDKEALDDGGEGGAKEEKEEYEKKEQKADEKKTEQDKVQPDKEGEKEGEKQIDKPQEEGKKAEVVTEKMKEAK